MEWNLIKSELSAYCTNNIANTHYFHLQLPVRTNIIKEVKDSNSFAIAKAIPVSGQGVPPQGRGGRTGFAIMPLCRLCTYRSARDDLYLLHCADHGTRASSMRIYPTLIMGKIGGIEILMRAADQKPDYHLEWPNN